MKKKDFDMNSSIIRKTIIDYFNNLGKTPGEDDDLFEKNFIDSMGLIEMITFIDQEIQVEISQEEMKIENFRTINDIVKTISKFT
jgi:acyl carrier protein